jgi:hypothetical protein
MARAGRGFNPFKSFGTIGFIAVLAFYVAWPAYSGYQIKTSLEAEDPAGLSAKIDFPSVRVSLRPVVAEKVDKLVTELARKAGPAGGALADQLKAKFEGPIVDGVLATMVTPEMMIRIAAEGRSLKDIIDGLVAERAAKESGLGDFLGTPGDGAGGLGKLDEIAGQLGIDTKGLGGLFGKKSKAEQPAAEALPAKSSGTSQRRRFGFGNIKQFGLSGPLGISLGVSRDASSAKAELTADMSFVDGDWKLTGLVPKI